MKPRYRILEKLGEGATGQVFLAEDLETGRRVAVKGSVFGAASAANELLRAEVRLLSRLSHPNLVQVFDFHAIPDGDLPAPFFTLEYVKGSPLPDAAAKAGPGASIDLFVQFCRGLAYLHAHGLLHGDVKPSNALVREDGVLKILDFGFSRPASAPMGGHGVTGTLAYMAPEALAGFPGPESDLFSLGKVFFEILEKRGRGGFPPPFSSLIDRLLEPAETRPRSAAALLRYLARHGLAEPLKNEADDSWNVSLRRPPWIHRPEEDSFRSTLNRWKRNRSTTFFIVSGPTGVGRTRFLEETRLYLQLEGVPSSDALFFPDLHTRDESALQNAEISLRSLSRRPSGPLVFLEFSDDRVSEGLRSFLNRIESFATTREPLALRDLSVENIRKLIVEASRGWDPAAVPHLKDDLEKIVVSSGGRPLLALELLENLRSAEAQGKPRRLHDLSAASAARASGLSEVSARLLAFVVTHPETVAADEMEKVWSADDKKEGFWDSLLELRAAGILDPTNLSSLALAHPALREDYARGLAPGLLQEVRARWIEYLSNTAENQGPSDASLFLAKHALASGNADVAERWGIAALERLSRLSRFQEGLEMAQDLLNLARGDLQKSLFHAYAATLLYRLGRYEDAILHYDLWFRLKPDDGTGVNHLKYLIYTGQSLLASLRSGEARVRFEDCLRSGDAAAHPNHRPYLVRAKILLANIAEKEKDWVRAEALLEEAALLVDGDAMSLGEIEQYRGSVACGQGENDTALGHLKRALGHFQAAQRPQAEALIWDRIGVLHRERGELASALEAMNQGLARTEAGGEILQKGRLLANRTLVFMDLGRYGPALKEMEEAIDILDVLGTEEDRLLAHSNLASLHAKLGLADPPASSPPESEGFPEPLASPEDIARLLQEISAVESPETRAKMCASAASRLESAGHAGLASSFRRLALQEYASIHANLPEELKMDFEKRPDLASLDRTLSQLAGPAPNVRSLPENRFRQYCEINRQIVTETDPERLLERVIDAAIEITGAERGFLLLKEPQAEGPLPGYEVKTARHLSRKTLAEAEFQISLTSVKDALSKLTYIVTDNAQKDPRYQEMKSVMDYQLKSILVVPLEAGGEAIGAVYLDHRYRPDCFSEQDVLFLSAFATQAAMALQKARMIEELSEARKHLESKVEQQTAQIENLREELTRKRSDLRYGYEEIVGQSPPMMKVFNLLDRVTETTIPVWIHGESGTGKELVARSLHFNSLRKNGPFVAENVSAIPETLLESELFGHKKGAFTHATHDRVGLFEQASKGTLFLDEIADMSPAMQAKLLRVLQEGEVRPVGSSKKVKIDVRLVTASNGDLREMTEEGKFRKDLFFRINGLTIELPPLRERKADIPLIARRLTVKISKEFQLPAAEIAPDALQVLLHHSWPGNVRELEASLRNALLFAQDGKVTAETLGALRSATESSARPKPPARERTPEKSASVPHAEEIDEREMILSALKRQKMDKPAAAKALSMCLKTLYVRMDAYGIPKKKPLLAKYLGIS